MEQGSTAQVDLSPNPKFEVYIRDARGVWPKGRERNIEELSVSAKRVCVN